VTGSSERPRLCVFFSGRHINAQVIDDSRGLTLVSVSTTEKDLRAQNLRPNVDHAAKVGQIVAERAKEKNINRVVFDRGGFTYHGKVKALADAAREAGLEF
jgi:large subunit ribosomal protein L18